MDLVGGIHPFALWGKGYTYSSYHLYSTDTHFALPALESVVSVVNEN